MNPFNQPDLASAASSAASHLKLSPEQLAQQADVCNRLLHMACAGVPTPAADSTVDRTMLAMHALITAYMTMAAANKDATDAGARLALAICHELTMTHELRLMQAKDPVVAAPATAH